MEVVVEGEKAGKDDADGGRPVVNIHNHFGDGAHVNVAGIAYGGVGHRLGHGAGGKGHPTKDGEGEVSHVQQPATCGTTRNASSQTSVKHDSPETILHKNTSLYDAVWRGELGLVRRLLSEGSADINDRTRSGRTVMMWAALRGHREVFQLLVEKGADLSLADDSGKSILELLSLKGSTDMVEYILSLKIVDINGRGQWGRTPLMWAAERGHTKLVQLLLRHGADPLLVTDGGNNILHLACRGGHVDIVKYILSHTKVDINGRGSQGWTSTMEASRWGHGDVVKVLVNKGADPSYVSSDGRNILHLACEGGYVSIVKYILSLDMFDINARNHAGKSGAWIAKSRGHSSVYDLLVARGGAAE
ncbi:ankyrin repeat domain-containing protein 29-like [Haliotis cracherodii]|uniref:ankyrin repeat domain-containing protein 29-like n=1 Tax=Haliotis cracherodii TaxID=6455 RepID=UPI0039EA6F27